MRTIAITLTSEYEAQHAPGVIRRGDRTQQHFAERGVNAEFFYGFHAEKLGLLTKNPYEVDAPGSGFNMGPKPTGIWLSHRALWSALLLAPEKEFLILEDDAKFAEDWHERFYQALRDAPPWDVLFLGSCCTLGRPTRHIAGEVYEVKWPMCLQAYAVQRSALETMIRTQDAATCYGPVDITLTFHTWAQLRVYTVLPRIVDQFDTDLAL